MSTLNLKKNRNTSQNRKNRLNWLQVFPKIKNRFKRINSHRHPWRCGHLVKPMLTFFWMGKINRKTLPMSSSSWSWTLVLGLFFDTGDSRRQSSHGMVQKAKIYQIFRNTKFTLLVKTIFTGTRKLKYRSISESVRIITQFKRSLSTYTRNSITTL